MKSTVFKLKCSISRYLRDAEKISAHCSIVCCLFFFLIFCPIFAGNDLNWSFYHDLVNGTQHADHRQTNNFQIETVAVPKNHKFSIWTKKNHCECRRTPIQMKPKGMLELILLNLKMAKNWIVIHHESHFQLSKLSIIHFITAYKSDALIDLDRMCCTPFHSHGWYLASRHKYSDCGIWIYVAADKKLEYEKKNNIVSRK